MTINTTTSLNKKEKVRNLLEKLRSKLTSFSVINIQGQLLGYVRNLTVDKKQHLNLVISKGDTSRGSPLFLLNSKYIQKVDSSNRALFVDFSPAELENLHQYQPSNEEIMNRSVSSPTPSVNQASISGETGEDKETQFSEGQSLNMKTIEDMDNQSYRDSEGMAEVVEEEIVRLLEERLVVNRSKRKVGEIVVRKEIETRIVEVPVQREKLIVEQVGPETKKLAEIDLGKGEVTGLELAKFPSSDTLRSGSDSDNHNTVTGEFLSPQAASNLLEAIALNKHHGCAKVRVELVVDNPELQESYQKMFDRCSKR